MGRFPRTGAAGLKVKRLVEYSVLSTVSQMAYYRDFRNGAPLCTIAAKRQCAERPTPLGSLSSRSILPPVYL